jgi:hypothetical protein
MRSVGITGQFSNPVYAKTQLIRLQEISPRAYTFLAYMNLAKLLRLYYNCRALRLQTNGEELGGASSFSEEASFVVGRVAMALFQTRADVSRPATAVICSDPAA